MCGIVGYIGNDAALEVLIKGLERLEYRGYDSAGVALLINDQVEIKRAVGRLSNLKEKLDGNHELESGTVGIGHTRWATHGGPTEVNAHPHRSGSLAMVHNGIVENYQSIRKDLEKSGYEFSSETDTEVATHLLNHLITVSKSSVEDALNKFTEQVEGSFAIVALSKENPEQVLVARRASPLVLGVGEDANFIGSDVTALLEYTRKFIYLEDQDYAVISKDQIKIYNAGKEVDRPVKEVEWDVAQAERGGYDHFMIKEICEQPKAVNDTLSGRLVASHSDFNLLELKDLRPHIEKLESIKLVACGTAWHACMVGKHMFENIARIHSDVELASEFRYQNPIIKPEDLFVCVSQSGETADTLAAVNLVEGQCPSVAITNVIGSSVSRKVDSFLLTQAGPEISVASTKAFVTQVLVLYLMALKFAKIKQAISPEVLEDHMAQITHLSTLIHKITNDDQHIKDIAEKYSGYKSFFFLGRGCCYPIALEGALKLKEITYLPAQGYAAGELKHGPIALIDPDVITVAVIQDEEPFFSKTLSNLNEVKSRDGKIIIVTDRQDTSELEGVADDIIKVPHQNHFLTPILTTVPLQLLAYYMAKKQDKEIDFPRNLAKSVTVE